MKKGWEYKRLKEVANFSSGYTPNKEEISNEGKYPYFKVAEMNIAGNELYMKNTSLFVNSPKKIFPKGSIIFPKNGGAIYTEKKRILEVDSVIDLNTEAIYPTAQVELMYLYFLLTFTKISSFDKGGGLPSLDLKKMSESIIPVPPLSEQQRIVDYLDAAFAKIDAMKANAEKSLNEAKALFQASLKEMLEPKEGWEKKKLGEIATKISDGSHNPPAGLFFSEYEMLSSKNIRNDLFNFDNPRYLSKEDFEKEDKRTKLEKGDVLLTIVGAGLGECCVYNFDKKIVFQRSVSVIKPSYDLILSRFLMYTLQNNYISIRNASNGAAQKGIYLKQLATYTVWMPYLSEQQSIVATLDSLKSKVDRLQANFEKISQECDALKQAILRQVFE